MFTLPLRLRQLIARLIGTASRAPVDSGDAGQLLPSGFSVAEARTLMAELRETVARLRESEHQLRLITDNAPVAIACIDTELRYTFVNRYLTERQGLASEQIIGRRVPEVIKRKAFAIAEPYMRECLAGKPVEFEVEAPDRTGQPRFIQNRFAPEWSDGRIIGLISATTDITRFKRTEAALRDSEAAFRAMFEVSSVGKIETECGTGRFLRVNAAMCKLVGYSEAELLATTAFHITHPDEIERDRALIRRLLAGELPVFDVEKRYIRKDGTTVWVHVTANVIRDESGRPLRSMAVIQDLTTPKRAEQELQASKDRLQLAFHATQLGWWQYDPIRGRLSGDERANEIFDVPKEGGTVEEIEEKRVHPDDVQRVHAAFEASIDRADPKPLAIEYRIRRDDGKVRWVENHGLAHFEGAGSGQKLVAFVGTVQDITERKEREEKEHLLMREINHRAKNMLSVVHSIAQQTATRNPEDFVESFSERIQSLSANQDLLVRNEWNGVEIEDLVRAQLEPFAGLIGSRIAAYGSKMRLAAASAQAIGLALHELSTNAGKYGALSTDKGRVDISWGTAGSTFTMSWTERDGPPVSAPERHGFGTLVMEAMVERSVDGKVDLDYAPSGATWCLTCPAANALEPGEREQISGDGENRDDSASRNNVKARKTA